VVVDDEQFAELIAERTATIPGVLAVTLGGSRAQGGHRPDSDWDFGLYYRGQLDPDDVRALGWAGTVFAPGEWGGGVMNGGAWLTVDGRRVDLHYRDLDDVEHHLAEAEQGRFKWALNEKHIVARAGLDELVPRFVRLGGTPQELRRAAEEIRTALVEQKG
jgi:predicted nucleotidyltransferase